MKNGRKLLAELGEMKPKERSSTRTVCWSPAKARMRWTITISGHTAALDVDLPRQSVSLLVIQRD